MYSNYGRPYFTAVKPVMPFHSEFLSLHSRIRAQESNCTLSNPTDRHINMFPQSWRCLENSLYFWYISSGFFCLHENSFCNYFREGVRLGSICLWLYSSLLGHALSFSFLIFYAVGRIPWTEDQPATRPLTAQRTAQIQNKGTQTSMPEFGFEPIISVLEHAIDRAANVIAV
jgi:hypothetical protein